MKCIINESIYSFSDENLVLLGKGEEGSCYRIFKHKCFDNNLVMKIHHSNPTKKILDEKTCKNLTGIETSKFLLPRSLVYNEYGQYIGYIREYKDVKYPTIRTLKIGKVINEFYKLEKDVRVLSENNIYIDDLNMDNTIFSDGIFIYDSGSFSLAEDENQKRFVGYYNKRRISEYEIEEVLLNLFDFTKKEQKSIRNMFSNLDEFLSEYLSYIVSEKEAENEGVKKFLKEQVRQ